MHSIWFCNQSYFIKSQDEVPGVARGKKNLEVWNKYFIFEVT